MDFKNFLAGGITGIIEVTCTHPIDLLKTKIQEYEQLGKKGSITKSFYNFSIKDLYCGYIPRVIGIFPMRLTYWGSQAYAIDILGKYHYKGFKRSVTAGIFAGAIQTVIDNPIEVMKTRMMTNPQLKFKDVIKVMKFPGLVPTLYRNMIFASCVSGALYYKKKNDHFRNFLVGATGGLLGSVITQPIDYIKTEFQRSGAKPNWNKMIDLFNRHPLHMMVGWKQRAILGFLNMGIGGMVYFYIREKLIKN